MTTIVRGDAALREYDAYWNDFSSTAIAVSPPSEEALGAAQVWRDGVEQGAAARLGRPVPLEPDDEGMYDPADCFARSLAHFDEIGLRRGRGLALRRWAEFLLASGTTADGLAMWQEGTHGLR